MTAQECAVLFGQELTDEPIRELLGLFAQSLNGLGQFLLQRFSGSFTAMCCGIAARAGAPARVHGVTGRVRSSTDLHG
jgi:hypothetical protein